MKIDAKNNLVMFKKISFVPLFLSLVLCTALFGCKEPNLIEFASKIQSITVYDLEGLSGETYIKSDLQNAFQASIDPDIFKELAVHAKYKDRWVL